MFKKILIPTDGSELSQKALTSGIAFARSCGAPLTVLTSTVPFQVVAIEPMMVSYNKEQYTADAEKAARKILAEAEAAARAVDLRCETVHVFAEHPYQAIIETAQARGCDLILMASHGRKGVAAALLGSETQKVLTHCKLPVLVWR
jgi:nucleotide-binding universal stress UspA family protein